MSSGKRTGSEGVPAVTLRADNPVHVKALLFAQEGINSEMGVSAQAAVELQRITREFTMFSRKRGGGLEVSCALLTGPQFQLFLSRRG
ncbi:MAG TPA: hypothetical protein VIN93_06720 [Bryobacteraceae bacterium]|jgi:hypothetical protein